MTTEIKISQLPAASSVNDAMEFEVNDSLVSKKITGSQLKTYAQSGLTTDSNTTTKGLYEHANTISVNYSISSGNNAMSVGPMTINSGVTVTVPSGSTWAII